MTILTAEKFEFLSIDRSSHGKAVRNPLNLLQLAENLEGANLKSCLSCRSCSQKNDCPRILLTRFGFVSCLNKGIAFALY